MLTNIFVPLALPLGIGEETDASTETCVDIAGNAKTRKLSSSSSTEKGERGGRVEIENFCRKRRREKEGRG